MTVASPPCGITSKPIAKSVGEIKAEHERWLDAQEVRTSCAVEGCSPRWKYVGPAGLARAAAASHRAEAHPDLKPRSLEQIAKQAKAKTAATALKDRQKETLRRMDQPKSKIGSPPKWTLEKAIEAIQAFAAEHGRPPTSQEARGEEGLPSPPTAKRLAGSWADLIEQSGFKRPHRGMRYGPPADAKATPEREADPEPEAAPSPAGGRTRAVSEGVTLFLAVLIRDHLPAGEVEAIIASHVERRGRKRLVYDNRHLEAYARELTDRLLQSDDPKED